MYNVKIYELLKFGKDWKYQCGLTYCLKFFTAVDIMIFVY